eukprot:scaffold3353_cov79-Cylindrotheca_fusiformis.AAC.3
MIRWECHKATESIPRSKFGIDQLSKARMMVPQQSSIANVKRLQKVSRGHGWDRSTFRSSNDGSAAIIHWECQLSRDDRPFLLTKDGLFRFPRLGSSDFRGSNDGSATVLCQQLKKAAETILRPCIWERSDFRGSNDSSTTIIK